MPKYTSETGQRAGRIGGSVRTSIHDPSELAKTGQRGLISRFERQVDPEGTLDPDERQRRALRLRRAHMMKLSARAGAARHAKAVARRAEREAANDSNAA